MVAHLGAQDKKQTAVVFVDLSAWHYFGNISTYQNVSK